MPIDPHDPHPRRTVDVLGTTMSFVDVGEGRPVVFLHGNPTSSYLWRNIIPYVADRARALAPDLVGMGRSGPSATGSYRFVDHARHLDAWFDAAGVGDDIVLVLHDWGSALGFDWARRHPDRVAGLVYMESILGPIESWERWPESGRAIFQAMRSAAGEEIVLDKNVFVERILPASVLRELTAEEMAEYRRPFAEPGERRRPTLTWPREIPIGGEPADVHEVVSAYADWLRASPTPKLYVEAEPGFLTNVFAEEAARIPAQRRVRVPGIHFIQEDAPDRIGTALREFVDELDA